MKEKAQKRNEAREEVSCLKEVAACKRQAQEMEKSRKDVE